MILLLLCTILIISPDTVSTGDVDITVVFEPPLPSPMGRFLLDGKEIKGEFQEDYFYYTPLSPLEPGTHTLFIEIPGETLKFSFKVTGEGMVKKEGFHLNYFSIGLGGEVNTAPETLAYTTYPPGKHPLFQGDIDFSFGNVKFSGNYFMEPEYPLGWYGLFELEGGPVELEGGSISPIFEELTLYSPTGAGLMSVLKYKRSSITGFYINSFAYDTIISEFPRRFGGLRAVVESLFTITWFRAVDDTTSFTGIPVTLPQGGNIISPMLSLHWKDWTFYGLYAISNATNNLYFPVFNRGFAREYGVKWHNFTFYYRNIDSLYIPLGNPYLEYGRRVCIEGEGEHHRIMFKTDNYLAFEQPFQVQEWSISFSVSGGGKLGGNGSFQFSNEENYSSLTTGIGGYLYTAGISASGMITGSWSTGSLPVYGLSTTFSYSGKWFLFNSSLSATLGETRQFSLSCGPILYLGPLQIETQFRCEKNNEFTESSFKLMVLISP